MQFSFKKALTTVAMASFLVASISVTHAAPPKTYTENEFLSTFSGKSKKVITDSPR